MEDQKIRENIVFYFKTGIVLYVTNNMLNVVDFYQRFGSDLWGYVGFLLYLGFNIFLLTKLKKMRNWARNLFIAKLFIFSVVFYPQAVILKSGSWMYSAHFPHGTFQHMSNLGNFLYEFLFTVYLLKRNVRLAFKRA